MKNLDHYLELNYRTEIEHIPAKLGGGYSACIPLLGRESVLGDGESVEEALQNLEIVKKEFFNYCIEKGTNIPEPNEGIENYSGKFIVRVARELHRKLVAKAKENNVSLNQYINFLLQEGMSAEKFKNLSALTDQIETSWKNISVVSTVVEPKDWQVDELDVSIRQNFYVSEWPTKIIEKTAKESYS
ncbi:MAG: toxin-antitoxin system HicB family antitoxin [Bacteroidota bacterium]